MKKLVLITLVAVFLASCGGKKPLVVVDNCPWREADFTADYQREMKLPPDSLDSTQVDLSSLLRLNLPTGHTKDSLGRHKHILKIIDIPQGTRGFIDGRPTGDTIADVVKVKIERNRGKDSPFIFAFELQKREHFLYKYLTIDEVSRPAQQLLRNRGVWQDDFGYLRSENYGYIFKDPATTEFRFELFNFPTNFPQLYQLKRMRVGDESKLEGYIYTVSIDGFLLIDDYYVIEDLNNSVIYLTATPVFINHLVHKVCTEREEVNNPPLDTTTP